MNIGQHQCVKSTPTHHYELLPVPKSLIPMKMTGTLYGGRKNLPIENFNGFIDSDKFEYNTIKSFSEILKDSCPKTLNKCKMKFNVFWKYS